MFTQKSKETERETKNEKETKKRNTRASAYVLLVPKMLVLGFACATVWRTQKSKETERETRMRKKQKREIRRQI